MPGSQDSVQGTVIIFDKNAREQGIDIRVPDIPITAIITSTGPNNTAYSVETQVSDSSGTAYFEFKADPPYSDSEYWGLIFLKLEIDDDRISDVCTFISRGYVIQAKARIRTGYRYS